MRRLSSFTSFSKMSLTACGSSRNIRHWGRGRETEKKRKIRRHHLLQNDKETQCEATIPFPYCLICCFHGTPRQRKNHSLSLVGDKNLQRVFTGQFKSKTKRYKFKTHHSSFSTYSALSLETDHVILLNTNFQSTLKYQSFCTVVSAKMQQE